ncbi:MAG: hypothetical protein M3Y87_10150 [Myxococcota bacterium]|nr:hypothetical protein [Myxococcota bacterium]
MARISACTTLAALLATAASGCCFGGSTPAPTSDPSPFATTSPTPATAPAAPDVTTTIALAPGFSPDPHELAGVAGGATPASSFGESCRGYVGTEPDHLLQLGGDFPALTITADATSDLTMVVQRPDGTYACNDDFRGLDPGISGAHPAGTYRVWIGTYSSTAAGAPYTLSVSTAPPL